MRDLASLDEPTLYAIGFDRRTVQAFAHILKAVGAVTNGTTLPDVAADTETNAITLAALQLLVTALQATAGAFEAELTNLPLSGNATQRRLADIEAQLESVTVANTRLTRRVAELENGVS